MCLLAERLVKQTTEFMKKNIQRDDNNKNKSSKTSDCYCAVRREASRGVLHLKEETAR